MNQVKSKYKNPDRYIQILKKQLEEAYDSVRRIDKLYESAHGDYLCSVDNIAEAKTLRLYGSDLDNLKPGDNLSIVVTATEVKKYVNDKGKRCSSVTWACVGQEMRKLGKDH